MLYLNEFQRLIFSLPQRKAREAGLAADVGSPEGHQVGFEHAPLWVYIYIYIYRYIDTHTHTHTYIYVFGTWGMYTQLQALKQSPAWASLQPLQITMARRLG